MLKRVTLALLALCPLATAAAADGLPENFATPPAAARPWVYWFWLNGNITRDGITADLEAMQRVGIGGVLIMEVDQGIPQGPGAVRQPSMARTVQARRRRGGPSRVAGDHEQRRRLVRQRRSLDQARTRHAEGRLDGNPGRRTAAVRAVLPQSPAVAGYYRDIAVLAFPTPPDDADPRKRFRIAQIEGKTDFVRAGRQLDEQEMAVVGRSWTGHPAGIPLPRRVGRSRDVCCAPPMPRLPATASSISPAAHRGGAFGVDVPAGKWTLLRLGHTPTGTQNLPSPRDGLGLECDKLSKEALDCALRRSDGEAHCRRRTGRRQDARRHARRQLGSAFAKLDAPVA